jgi:hypothetical protein
MILFHQENHDKIMAKKIGPGKNPDPNQSL